MDQETDVEVILVDEPKTKAKPKSPKNFSEKSITKKPGSPKSPKLTGSGLNCADDQPERRRRSGPYFMAHTEIEEKYGKSQIVPILREAVNRLKTLPQPAQRSEQWYKMRDGMLTASDWGTAMGESHYEKPSSVIKKKCGYGEVFTGNDATRWGQKYEPVAIMIYERRNGTRVVDFGLIPHPEYSFLGASPDGITEDGVMVEIKCPPKRKITGEPPRHYWCQVQAQLEVCRLERCDFLECKLDEFASADEYYRWSSENYEKGIVVVFKKPLQEGETVPTRYYEYLEPVIGPTNDDTKTRDIQLVNELKAKHPQEEFEEVTYWRLITVSCVPIFRDQAWFADALPKLRETWQQIENYRANGGIEKLDEAEKLEAKLEAAAEEEMAAEVKVVPKNVNPFALHKKPVVKNFHDEQEEPSQQPAVIKNFNPFAAVAKKKK